MTRKKVSKRNKTLAKQQRLRRAELKVQRVEAQLYGKTPRDTVISERLDKLGRGERGEYIKQAIYEKIAREIAPAQPATNDLDAMRAIVEDAIAAQLSGLSITMEQAQRVTITTAPEPANVVQSGGISMDRPRPRPKIARTEPAQITAPDVPDVLSDDDQIRLAGLMADSIKKAQPGKGQ